MFEPFLRTNDVICWVMSLSPLSFAPTTEKSGSRAGQTGGAGGGYSHKDAGTAEDGVHLFCHFKTIVYLVVFELTGRS